MKNLLKNKTFLENARIYLLVTVAFVVMFLMSNAGMLSSSWKGYLVPICAYISLAVSLNLLVGVCGELSLGHAGFMGIGAFSGIIVAALLKDAVASDALRLLIAMLSGGLLAGIVGFVIGILIGTIIAVVRVMPKYKRLPRILDKICVCYIELFRGTPMVVQLLIGYWVLLPLIEMEPTA